MLACVPLARDAGQALDKGGQLFSARVVSIRLLGLKGSQLGFVLRRDTRQPFQSFAFGTPMRGRRVVAPVRVAQQCLGESPGGIRFSLVQLRLVARGVAPYVHVVFLPADGKKKSPQPECALNAHTSYGLFGILERRSSSSLRYPRSHRVTLPGDFSARCQ